jgi:hypothetical protein
MGAVNRAQFRCEAFHDLFMPDSAPNADPRTDPVYACELLDRQDTLQAEAWRLLDTLNLLGR